MKKAFVIMLLTLCLVVLPALSLAADTAPETLIICNDMVSHDKYYVANASGGLSEVSTKPASGYLHYNKETGVLTLNNISLTASNDVYGIRISGSQYPDGRYGKLTINVVGTNAITGTGSASSIYLDKINCTISGSGTLTVTCANMSAMQVRSLTVSDPVTLNLTANGAALAKAIESTNDISFSDGTITAKAPNGDGIGILSIAGNISISGKAKVDTHGKSFDLSCGGDHKGNNGKLTISGGQLTASGADVETVWAQEIDVSGGKVNITRDSALSGLSANKLVKISEDADVTINLSKNGCTIWSGKDVTISGGTLNLSTKDWNAVSAYEGKLSITGGSITAKADSATLYGNKGIEISGGELTAISTANTPLYTEQSLSITGGKVAASCESGVYYSTMAMTSTTVNGDAVVYGKAFYNMSTPTKGVVYTGTTVSLDKNNKPVLSGGVGTVYGNPNVPSFTKPANSKLGTVLDEYVTITAPDVEYTGRIADPNPVVEVNKIALSRTLTKGADFTVDGTGSTPDEGPKTFKAVGVNGSGNIGEKDFTFNVIPRTTVDTPPSTGDNSRIELWFTLLILAGAALLWAGVSDRKNRMAK